jgi:PAS domain S-box-containing protein
LEKIDSLLPQAVTTVRLLNEETEELEPVACRNIDQKDKEAWKALRWKGTKSLAKVVIDTRQPLIVPNLYLDPRTREPEILKKYGLVSYLGVPLIVRGETLGLIAFYTKEEHQFNDEETEFLSTLAGQAAIAIHNSQLYEKAKHQAIALERSHKRTAALHEINLAMTSSLDLQTMLNLLLEKIDLLLPYSVATVRLLNRETGVLNPTACRNLDEREWKAGSGTGGHGLTKAVLESRAPVFIADARVDPRTKNPEQIVKYGLCSYLGFPLIIKDEILGVISFYTKEEHRFSTEEIEFLSALAGQAAISIHNSQLYEKTEKQRIALQKSEERFRSIARATNDAVWDWNLITNAVWWNEGVRTLFGYSEGEVGPDANWWYDHIHPEDREEVITGIHTLIHSGAQFWSDEYRYRRADDSFAHVFDRGYVIRDGNGNPVHMIGAMMDITERKVLQKKISEIREMEQQRIGQDLHDGLGQHLTGLACLAKGLEQKLTARSTPEVADARLITGLINEAIAQTRNLARGLYPVEVQANGLMWALEELATRTARIFDISCVFECNEPVLIDVNAVAIHLYHIAQGAVDNAVKHGKAAHIVIRLCAEDGKITLLVKDDGIGFPVNFWTEPNSGMGVHIMKYRAEMIGGSLVIRRGAEGGTVLSCVFPNPIPSEED